MIFEIEYSIDKIDAVAKKLMSICKESRIFAFYGELGAGKTALIKSICKHLLNYENVSSPTFSIVNLYENQQGRIYHFDLYRLNNDSELLEIGFGEYLDSGNICLIEWGEKGEAFYPIPFYKVFLTTLVNQERKMEVFLVEYV